MKINAVFIISIQFATTQEKSEHVLKNAKNREKTGTVKSAICLILLELWSISGARAEKAEKIIRIIANWIGTLIKKQRISPARAPTIKC